MQYTFTDLLLQEHILLNLEAENAAEVIKALVGVMSATGHVDLLYAEDVIEREKTFPTGLPTEPLQVAIPHADPDHVKKSGVGIAVLNQPVEFGMMGTDGSERVNINIVILLAIKEQEKQVEMLQQLVTVIQSGELLTRLVEVQDAAEVVQLIKDTSSTG